MNYKSVLVLGGGISGCSAAYFLKNKGYQVTLVESEKTVGGLCKTNVLSGINYEFGPHICYARDNTPAYQIFHELLPEFKSIKYFPKQSMDGELDNLATFPITVTNVFNLPKADRAQAIYELYQVNLDKPDYTNFETYIISRVGKTMYEYCYKNYNRKQWGMEPQDMDSEWARFRNFYLRAGDYGMFGDMWQGHPESYDKFFERLTEGINIIHDTVESIIYDGDNISEVKAKNGSYTADIIISTLPIDFICNQRDLLDYRGITKLFYSLEGDSGLPTYLCTFPNHYSWTRITDYKLQSEQAADDSLISFAIPHSSRDTELNVDTWKNEAETFIRDKMKRRIKDSKVVTHRYVYPISSAKQLHIYEGLINKAATVKNLLTFGRLGLYSYISMCTAVNQARSVADNVETFLEQRKSDRISYYKKLREELS